MTVELNWHTRRDNRPLKSSHSTALRELLELVGVAETRAVIELSGAAAVRQLQALAAVCDGTDPAGRAALMEIAAAVHELGTRVHRGRRVMRRNEPTTLITICRGSALSLFSRELERVLENIHDETTHPTKVRTITIKVHFEPNVTRTELATMVEASSKIAPPVPIAGTTFTGKRTGSDGQIELFATEASGIKSPIGEPA